MIHKILVADDTQFFRSLIREMLVSKGYEVLEAENGSEAVAAYGKEKPDLVLMDLVMPGMDGVTASKNILELDPQARIILCSGAETSTLLRRATEVKLSGIQFKPINGERLLELIEKLGNQA